MELYAVMRTTFAARQFTAEVWVGGQYVARGQGTSKREAEQQAARAALEALGEAVTTDERR